MVIPIRPALNPSMQPIAVAQSAMKKEVNAIHTMHITNDSMNQFSHAGSLQSGTVYL